MYNRYIPQPDGSFHRSRMPEPAPYSTPPPEKESSRQQDTPPKEAPHEIKHPTRQHPRLDGFLRQLLPKDFDTGDLIVILLLLLMAGDCEEDRNNALLTIALYFMM